MESEAKLRQMEGRRSLGLLLVLALHMLGSALESSAEEPRLIAYTDVDFRGDSLPVSADLPVIEYFDDYWRPISSIDVLTEEWVILFSGDRFTGSELRVKGPVSIRDLGQVKRLVGPCFLGFFRFPLNWRERVNSIRFAGKDYVPDSCGTTCRVSERCGRLFSR